MYSPSADHYLQGRRRTLPAGAGPSAASRLFRLFFGRTRAPAASPGILCPCCHHGHARLVLVAERVGVSCDACGRVALIDGDGHP